MEVLTKKQAQLTISKEQPLSLYYLEELDLYNQALFKDEMVNQKIVIENCHIEILDLAIMQFNQEVVLRGCIVGRANFHGTFFLKGIKIEECLFKEILNFDCGGHNEAPYPVKLLNSTFRGYVDFFDAWFMGPFVVSNCKFLAGTNMLLDPSAFEIKPEINNNEGDLELESK